MYHVFVNTHPGSKKYLSNSESFARLKTGTNNLYNLKKEVKAIITNTGCPFGPYHTWNGYWNQVLCLNILKVAEHSKSGNTSFQKHVVLMKGPCISP